MNYPVREVRFGLGEDRSQFPGLRYSACVWFSQGTDNFSYVVGLSGYLKFVLYMPWFIARRRWANARDIVEQRWPT